MQITNINLLSLPKRIWNDINLLTGSLSTQSIKYLKSGSNMLFSSSDIANCFAKHWSVPSEDYNFSPNFHKHKSNVCSLTYNPKSYTTNANEIELPINVIELEDGLKVMIEYHIQC